MFIIFSSFQLFSTVWISKRIIRHYHFVLFVFCLMFDDIYFTNNRYNIILDDGHVGVGTAVVY